MAHSRYTSVFFPAYTLVKTNEGNKLISKIKTGDMILTRKDYHRCIAVSKRKYSDSMNTIQTNIGELTASVLILFGLTKVDGRACNDEVIH